MGHVPDTCQISGPRLCLPAHEGTPPLTSPEPHTVLTRALTAALRGWDGGSEHTFVRDHVLPIIAAHIGPHGNAETRALLADHSRWSGYADALRFALKERVDVEARIAAELDYAQHRLSSIGRDLERTGERLTGETT